MNTETTTVLVFTAVCILTLFIYREFLSHMEQQSEEFYRRQEDMLLDLFNKQQPKETE